MILNVTCFDLQDINLLREIIMKSVFKVLTHLSCLFGSIVFGVQAGASVFQPDSKLNLGDNIDSSQEVIDVDVKNQDEIDRLYELIRLMNLRADTLSYEEGKIKLKMPRRDIIQLAGQIWREK